MKFLCCDKRSLYSWFSGFFAAASFFHMVCAVFGFSLVVDGHAIPRGLSAAVCVVLGAVSISLCWIGHKNS